MQKCTYCGNPKGNEGFVLDAAGYPYHFSCLHRYPRRERLAKRNLMGAFYERGITFGKPSRISRLHRDT